MGVDFKALILQIATFVLVFYLLKRFALDRIIKTLEQRRETINAGVRLGQEMAEEKAKLQEQIDQALKKARAEADKIIMAGHRDASTLLKETEAKASKKLDDILAESKVRIDEEMKKARQALEKEMLNLVAEATEAVLVEKLDSDADMQLIKRELQKVGRDE